MKPKLSLKTLFRSPVKTVLTFLLILAVTFSLFSQVLEYSVAKREMEKAVAEYKGVGSVFSGRYYAQSPESFEFMFADERVENHVMPERFEDMYHATGWESLTGEQVDKIRNMPYISHTDTRYLTAGVTKYRRLDINTDFYEYTNNCVIEGTAKSVDIQGRLILGDVKCIGGEPISPVFSRFGEVDILIEDEPKIGAMALKDEMETDYLLYYGFSSTRMVNVATDRTKYFREVFDTLTMGERYVFVLHYEDYLVPKPDTYTYYLTDVFSYGQCEAIYPLKDEPENYLETEKFAPLREYIEIIETDMYTQDMVYTYDMDSIRYFADGTMGISEGRALSPEDTELGNNVCVVHHDFAQEYGLKIGDKITVDLGNKLFENNYQTGAVAAVKARMSTSYTTAEIEIVGIFKDARNKYAVLSDDDVAWGFSKNTIFIPQHLLNVEESELENHEIYPQEFSFVIGDAWELDAFRKEVLPQFEEMELEVIYVDGGFGEIITAYRETERIALIKIAILLFAIIVITWFVSMLYIVGRRRDYAIMRLLGTSKAKSARSLLLPLGVIAVAAVILGSAAAYVYTLQNIAGNASLAVLSGFEIDLSVPVWVIIACVAGEIALTVILAFLLLSIIGRKSPLELMQANAQKGKKRRKKKAYAPEPSEPVVLGQWQSIERIVPDGKNRSGKFALNYAARHIKRTVGKALMFIIVTALLINVAGQLIVMKNSYVEIFENTEVVSKYAGFLNISYVQDLIDSGYVEDVYYHSNQAIDIDRENSIIFVSNNPYKLAEEKEYQDYNIEWLEGYDISSMYRLGNVAVMGKEVMAERGWSLGDTVEFSAYGWYDEVTYIAVRNFRMETPGADAYTDEEIIEMYQDEILERYNKKIHKFTIIGVVSDGENRTGMHIYTPGCDEAVMNYGKLVIPPEVTAVLADNYKAEEYREFGMGLAGKNLTGEIAFIMDTSKIENVRNNIDLMDMLYPIMVVAILIIGAFLCGMMIVQTSKDIAIMRVLGTPKRKVRGIMILEQMILCVLGIVLSAVALLIRGVFAKMLAVFGLYVAVIFLASLIASSLASRKSPLELLQTKE